MAKSFKLGDLVELRHWLDITTDLDPFIRDGVVTVKHRNCFIDNLDWQTLLGTKLLVLASNFAQSPTQSEKRKRHLEAGKVVRVLRVDGKPIWGGHRAVYMSSKFLRLVTKGGE